MTDDADRRSIPDDPGGLAGLLRRATATFLEPVPGGARWFHALFAVALALLAVLVVTGVLLSLAYVPHPTAAWASTFFIQESVRGGWFVRGVHMAAGHALLVVLVAHLSVVAVVGGYRAARRAQWWVALVVVAVVLGALISGHRLAWDQNNYWALQVELNVAGALPVLGDPLRRLVMGGASIGQLTLTRLYGIHVAVLPASLLGAVLLWRALRRADGPAGADDRLPAASYGQRQALVDGSASLLVIVAVVVAAAVTGGAGLGGPAEPERNFPARPEWFIMPLYELRALAPPALEIVAVAFLPALAVALLAAVPWLDRGAPGDGLRRRWPALAAFFAVMLPAAGLVGMGELSPVDEERAEALADAADRADRAFALAREGIPPGGPLEMLANDPLTRGRDVYLQYCTSCHVLDDHGDRDAPDHTGFASEAWILALLHEPRAPHFFGETPIDDMPSQTEKGDAALRGAAAYLFSLGVDPEDEDAYRPAPELVARGKALWEDKCMTCHVFEGDGDFLGLGGPDLTGYGTLAWIVRQTATPEAHYGELNDMPAFADQLTPHDLQMVSAFLRLQRHETPVFPETPPEPGKGDDDEPEDAAAARPSPARDPGTG